jgi:hypothetical protein
MQQNINMVCNILKSNQSNKYIRRQKFAQNGMMKLRNCIKLEFCAFILSNFRHISLIMVKHLFLIFSLILSLQTNAQTGIGTTTPHASAKLDITSTDKGFLPPRMTALQRTGIGSPANGLMVYQTDGTPGLYYFNGTSWIFIINSTTNVVSVVNGGTGTTTSTGTGSVVLNTNPSIANQTLTTPALGVATGTSITLTGSLIGGNTNTSNISGFGASIVPISANYSITAADNGEIIQSNASGAITITIPTGLPTGFNCTVVQWGTGQITFSGTYINRGNFTKSASQYAVVSILHLGSNNIIVSGEMSN